MKGIRLVSRFIDALLKKKLAIKSVWIGGGGNIGGNKCAEMTRTWIVEEVYHNNCQDLGVWHNRPVWISFVLK
jgi:hypothetical protein